jgi:predicted esterase
MRSRAALEFAAIFIAVIGTGCGGDDAECSGAAFTGGPVACGTTGVFDRTVCVEGKRRYFREYVPETVTCDAPAPLIVFLHGTGSDENSGDVARPIADELGAVYVTLRGYDQEGHLGFGPEGIPNSRTFLTMVIDEVKKEFPSDPQFTLLTGFSAGGFFSAYCIAWLNDRLAGVGIFAGGIAENFRAEFSAAPIKLPVLVRIGTRDSLQSYGDALITQLKASGWPDERLDGKRFEGGHAWSPDMIREAYNWAKPIPP